VLAVGAPGGLLSRSGAGRRLGTRATRAGSWHGGSKLSTTTEPVVRKEIDRKNKYVVATENG